jgi:hypothetical protein
MDRATMMKNAGQVLLAAIISLSGLIACAARERPEFSHSADITNIYLPLASLHQDTLVGFAGEDSLLVVRTMTVGTRTFTIDDDEVTAAIREDRMYGDDELTAVVLDYFAQSDEGTVYSLGRDVNDYDDGHVVGHEGSWLYGRDTQILGIVMPAHPAVGDTFSALAIPNGSFEHDQVMSINDSLTVPGGWVGDCVRIRATSSFGTVDKYYAPGVGVVRDVFGTIVLELKSHR